MCIYIYVCTTINFIGQWICRMTMENCERRPIMGVFPYFSSSERNVCTVCNRWIQRERYLSAMSCVNEYP